MWIFLELKVSIAELDREEKTYDFGTFEIYAVGQGLTFLSALWFDSFWIGPQMVHFFGIFTFIAGVCFRRWAVRSLGEYYSHIVRTFDEHKIVTSGPYRLTRHPAYTGMIVANIGVVLYFFNWFTLSIFLLFLLPAIVFRIIVEEKTLFEIEGYADFAQRRKRLFPLIW